MEICHGRFVAFFFVVSFAWQFELVTCLNCYTCSNVSSVAECKLSKTCNGDKSVCSTTYTSTNNDTLITMGCEHQSNCQQVSPSVSSSLVGRSLSNRVCTECCSFNHCNRQLCQQDPACADHGDFNCPTIGATINYCDDTHRARQYCRNFCGLCSLLDGEWSFWTGWSECDVSCDNGTQTRTRTCNNPKPTNGGDDCVGSTVSTQACTLKACPVHGGWDTWTSWGSCSSTCDIGLQRRDRNCSNPYPSADGRYCVGDSWEFRVCSSKGCLDGGWSVWGQWSSCSSTCGYGMRSRSRNCDNPAPSITGRDCVGDPIHSEICNIGECTGKVAFMAHRTDTHKLNNTARVIFNEVPLNLGSHYHAEDGTFVAPRNGTYLFSVYACANDTHTIYLKLMVNQNDVGHLMAGDAKWRDCISQTFILQLAVKDNVYVQLPINDVFVYYYSTFNFGGYPSFTGVLL